MPLTPDPYEVSCSKQLANENTPDHAGATADVAEGIESNNQQEEGI